MEPEKVSFMTVGQLQKACDNNDFIVARYRDGVLIGINTKVAKVARKKREYNDNDTTAFISWFACDFMTYLFYKRPFLTKLPQE
jgi:hypothetical protein